MSDDVQTPAQIEALRDLLSSQGWQLFRAAVMEDITGRFEDQITTALDNTDAAIAIDRMRQVAAIRKAGLRWLQWPKERLDSLTRQVITAHESHALSDARRPRGL